MDCGGLHDSELRRYKPRFKALYGRCDVLLDVANEIRIIRQNVIKIGQTVFIIDHRITRMRIQQICKMQMNRFNQVLVGDHFLVAVLGSPNSIRSKRR